MLALSGQGIHSLGAVASDEKDRHGWIEGPEGTDEFVAIHPWHHDVCNDQGQVSLHAIGKLEGFLAIARLHHAEIPFLEEPAHDGPHYRFVIHNEDGS